MDVAVQQQSTTDPRLGMSVVHRRYVPRGAGYAAGGVLDASYTLRMFEDAVIEMCIRTDGDEGQLVGYSGVDLLEPVHPGDVLEAEATLTRIGNTSRAIALEARVVCRAVAPEELRRHATTSTAARVLEEPLVVMRATGTVVVE
ncbi:hypothetical protein DT076_02085 [Desertihabitans brevis]|uniref:Thioesterase domain-containing protein n=1 Tax=Desertihabitans brevis TaxID=2268447 RepID=A0A367Z037_9ACTN|nr:hotdog domain-containing protein [Desertihabitans brevis]RCK71257.1 hypothetical protein DT076_02085 [Desertihabitans brevis]